MFENQKFPLDMELTINERKWRIAEYKKKFGMVWGYTLSHETVSGEFKSMFLEEDALETIITGSGVLGEEPNLKTGE